MKFFVHILFVLLLCKNSFAQYPQYFSYNDENSLPSNEVYSIAQDKKGFIWIGCAAGLFKFDGVRYIPYLSKTQNSKSLTGLTFSSSGKLYCSNFNSQIFNIENDTLKELKHSFTNIISLVSDKHGNIYATHLKGISRYSENKKQWHNLVNYENTEEYGNIQCAAKLVKGNECKVISLIYSSGIATIENQKIKKKYDTKLFSESSAGNFEIEAYQNSLWIFAKETDTIYRFFNQKLELINNTQLNKILKGKKVTNVKALPDSNLWICTYKGIIKFNMQNNKAELFYPDFTFSDCMIDIEGNYWFTTLQEGLLRVPNLSYKTWHEFNKLSRITNSNSHIFFADQKGKIGKLNLHNESAELFSTKYDADIQSFDYDILTNTLFFNINNYLFQLKNNTITENKNFNIKAIKSIKNISNTVFTASSHGVFINDKRVSYNWARQIKHDTINKCVWIATNDGLLKFLFINKKFYLSDTLFTNTQILSIDFNATENLIYALAFTGQIFAINNQNMIFKIAQIPENVQANKLISHHNKLYLATNKGIAVFNKKQDFVFFKHLSGLVSDNVQDITIVNSNLWLATPKGLQQIPLKRLNNQTTPAKIYIKNKSLNLELNYKEAIILNPEVVHYSSNAQFEFAYRINQQDWIQLPATIEQIEIHNIPTGNFEIELKAIDCFGNDSENIIVLNGYVNPPFWRKWWFASVIVLLVAMVIFIAVKKRIKLLKQKQQREIDKIQLENELRLSRETALKSQMNPHFIFNVLNSIKTYIYKSDKQNASDYLNKFSDLIRAFLSMSNKPLISIADELKMLELYITLEAMLLKDDFSFAKNIHPEIDLQHTKIPSLIIQPFIENAFKHGLHNKLGEKKLTLSAHQTEQNLIIIKIIDNGIGRDAAQKIKQVQPSHESFATTAIEKRIELLNKSKKKISVVISDLFDENNNASGTCVTLKINIDE